jgi:hypothetical protein
MIRKNNKLKEDIYENFIKGTNLPAEKLYKEPFIDSSLLKLCINELFMSTPAAVQSSLYLSYQYLAFPDE